MNLKNKETQLFETLNKLDSIADLIKNSKEESSYLKKLSSQLEKEKDELHLKSKNLEVEKVSIIHELKVFEQKLNNQDSGNQELLNKIDLIEKENQTINDQLHKMEVELEESRYKITETENINKNLIPDAESLKDTFKRVIPYYEKNILPILKKEKNVIISAHGNSLRSLCKKIFNIADGSIVELEIPTGNPIHITFKDDMSLSKYLYLDQKRAKKILVNE